MCKRTEHHERGEEKRLFRWATVGGRGVEPSCGGRGNGWRAAAVAMIVNGTSFPIMHLSGGGDRERQRRTFHFSINEYSEVKTVLFALINRSLRCR